MIHRRVGLSLLLGEQGDVGGAMPQGVWSWVVGWKLLTHSRPWHIHHHACYGCPYEVAHRRVYAEPALSPFQHPAPAPALVQGPPPPPSSPPSPLHERGSPLGSSLAYPHRNPPARAFSTDLHLPFDTGLWLAANRHLSGRGEGPTSLHGMFAYQDVRSVRGAAVRQ
jgi:hypothetical protein